MGKVTVTVNNLYPGKVPGKLIGRLKRTVRRVAGNGQRGAGSKEVSVTFVDDKYIRALNKRFRRLDKATDVLSFEMDDKKMLGDIVISVDSAKRNAKRFKVSFDDEVLRLVVHGTLHLLGFDHLKAKERAIMRVKEQDHLEKIL